MLNLNVSLPQFLTDSSYQLRIWPAMRPSAAQLLQHEQLELFNRLADAEKCKANQTPSKLSLNPFSGSGFQLSKLIATP